MTMLISRDAFVCCSACGFGNAKESHIYKRIARSREKKAIRKEIREDFEFYVDEMLDGNEWNLTTTHQY